MAATNLDFLINVDISGVPRLGDIKNMNTVLIVFDGTFSGVDVFESAADVDGSAYSADQKSILKHALQQQGVLRVLSAEVDGSTTLQDVLDANSGFFAVVFADDDAPTGALFDDIKGSEYLLAYAVESDGDSPPTPDDTYDNIFAFADDGVDDDGDPDALKPYKLAAGAFAKVLAFDPDRRAAQMDWQSITGQGVSHYTATERTTLLGLHYNIYGKNQGRDIISDGVNTQGMPINVVVAKYWLQARLREAIAAHQHKMVNQYGMNPYDSDGIAGVVDVCYNTLERGSRIGHTIDGYNNVETQLLEEVSQQDLQAGLMAVNVESVQRWRIHEYRIRGVINPTVEG